MKKKEISADMLVRNLLWVGPNSNNISGWSSKIYILTVKGNRFIWEWGAVEHVRGGLEPVWLQGRHRPYPSHALALRALKAKLAEKNGPRSYGRGYRLWRGRVLPVRGKRSLKAASW
jgi:hypothetical protein